MIEPNKGSSGYGDSDKLQAAKELSQSFKRGPGKGKGKARSEDSSPRPDWRQLPRPYYQSTAPQLLNIPLPSQRSYSNNWVPNPAKTASGPIIGKKAMDFLTRQDVNEDMKSEDQGIKGGMDHGAQNSKCEPTDKTSYVQPHVEKLDLSITSKGPTAAGGHPTTTSYQQSSPMAVQESQPSTHPTPTERQSHPTQLRKETVGNKGIIDTFFSLLDEDSEDMPQGLIPSLTSKPSSVIHDTPTQEAAKPTGQVSAEDGHGAAIQSMGIQGTFPRQSQSRGKMNDSEAQRDKRLRPEAPGFIPNPGARQALSGRNDIESPPVRLSSVLPANAAGRLLPGRENTIQSSELLTAGHIVQTGPSFGHLICSTPVQVTNGCITPGSGPTTGTLWLQTPVAINGMAPASGPTVAVSHPHLVPGRAAPSSSSSSREQPSRAQKPTVGLKGSMWA